METRVEVREVRCDREEFERILYYTGLAFESTFVDLYEYAQKRIALLNAASESDAAQGAGHSPPFGAVSAAGPPAATAGAEAGAGGSGVAGS